MKNKPVNERTPRIVGILLQLINKYRAIILYLFFGFVTMVLNIVSYDICYKRLNLSNVASTVIAWLLAVIVAYITNKLFVFECKSFNRKTLLYELSSFFTCRILTGIMDVLIMYISVDVLNMNSLIWKTVSNIIVIVLNYIASKMIIFAKK